MPYFPKISSSRLPTELKQSPKNLYETPTGWLQSIGFPESSCDLCLYTCGNKVSMVFFHVGNLILVGPGNNFKHEFETRSRNSSRHNPNTILGMRYKREDNKIKLSLPKHIEHGLEELCLTNCKSSVWQYLKGTADLKLTLEIKKPDQIFQIYSNTLTLRIECLSLGTFAFFLALSLLGTVQNKDMLPTCLPKRTSLIAFWLGSTLCLIRMTQRMTAFHEGIWLKALLAEIWNIQLDAVTHLIDDPDLNEQLMMTDEKFKEKFANEHLINNKGLDDKESDRKLNITQSKSHSSRPTKLLQMRSPNRHQDHLSLLYPKPLTWTPNPNPPDKLSPFTGSVGITHPDSLISSIFLHSLFLLLTGETMLFSFSQTLFQTLLLSRRIIFLSFSNLNHSSASSISLTCSCQLLCVGSFLSNPNIQITDPLITTDKTSSILKLKQQEIPYLIFLYQPFFFSFDMQDAPAKLLFKLHMFAYVTLLAQSLCSLHRDCASKLGS
ncbi:hypothetical protein VP01_3507g2 [Puccinia sorghi]|uniref:Uncharacterized protein n=1 Tax=Puccinia sorghi TaxID=27349 RepID=A0A0L6UVS0_9BASI|nr:hypothetical protein VP01_3507g2 [Puccinia sorghi]